MNNARAQRSEVLGKYSRPPLHQSQPTPPITRNRLLMALSDNARVRLRPHLEPVHLPTGKVVIESGDSMRYAYFPTDCIMSLLYITENGASAEICMVGNDGMLGVSIMMGGDSTPGRAVVQNGGFAYRLPARVLQEEFNRRGSFSFAALRYMQAMYTQMAQTAVCNRHHTIDQQVCRFLLLSQDRSQGNQLSLTQELIANMLGVRREGVTEAANKLQRAGIIDYRRGRIWILDRERLERASCECYGAVRNEITRLFSDLLPVAPDAIVQPEWHRA